MPHAARGAALATRSLDQWPSYCAYADSFAVIGIIWVNHHGISTCVATVDRPLLFINLLLLTVHRRDPVPHGAARRAPAAREVNDANIAVAVYGRECDRMRVGFNLMWRWIVRDASLLHPHLDLAQALQRKNTRRVHARRPDRYPIAIGMSFVSARSDSRAPRLDGRVLRRRPAGRSGGDQTPSLNRPRAVRRSASASAASFFASATSASANFSSGTRCSRTSPLTISCAVALARGDAEVGLARLAGSVDDAAHHRDAHRGLDALAPRAPRSPAWSGRGRPPRRGRTTGTRPGRALACAGRATAGSMMPTLTSSTGSSVSETRIVSPIPSARSVPIPTADFTPPIGIGPASVTPRCSG